MKEHFSLFGSLGQTAAVGLGVMWILTFGMLSFSGTAHAQADFEKGFQGYQSYHGSDFDTVNLANGNLILDIPLLSYPQRGSLPPIVVSIRSNSTTFQSDPPYLSGPPDTKQHEVSSGVIGSPWGQPHVVLSPGGLTWREERITTASHTANGGPEYLTRFVALDDSGATHSLGNSIANQIAGVVPGTRYSVDGSGLMLQPGTSQTGPVLVDRKGNVGGVTDPNGNTIAFNGSCARPPGSGDYFDPSLASWEGYAHGTAAAISLSDSIGRVIPNPSYLPPAVPYSCIVDLDASYHPSNPDANGCETWQFPGQNGTQVPLVFCYQQVGIQGATIPTPLAVGTPVPGGGVNTYACNPPVNGAASSLSCETLNETWWVLSKVILPNQTTWQLSYDNYGQVQSITLPTGAKITYTYATRLACGNPPGQIPVTGVPTWPSSNLMSSRMVIERQLSLQDGAAPKTWTYSSTIGSGWGSSPNAGQVTVTDPDMNDTVHTFSLQGSSVCGPYETSTVYYQGSSGSGTKLKEEDTQYTNTGGDFANPTNFANYISVGVLPSVTSTSLPTASGSVVDQSTFTYDTYGTYQDYVGVTHPFSLGQLLSSTDRDWGLGAPGVPLSTTLHTRAWQANWAYFAANLIDLPCLDTTFSGTFTGTQPNCNLSSVGPSQASQTAYVYDEKPYSYSGSVGNLTSVNHWLSGASAVTTHTAFTASSHGMPTQRIDANGNIDQILYDATGMFPSSVQHPTTYSNGVAILHIDRSMYDPNTGLLATSIDENSQPTLYTYDMMRRLQYVQYPDGGSESYTFQDSVPSPSFTYAKVLNHAGQQYSAIGRADALGRVTQTQVSAPEGVIYKDTTYDNLGRVATVSNPYRSLLDVTYGITAYVYDALGRKRFQCEQDNLPSSAGICTPGNSYLEWGYAGNTTTSYDELRNAWQQATDAHGRLTGVTEPGGLQTTYLYDTVGDLLCVDQWQTGGVGTPCTSSHKRSFTYDTLKRLILAGNPETGTVCYGLGGPGGCSSGYDPAGNLLYKTDARGITVRYAYDALNRLTSKSYVNDSTGTATACYQYDASPFSGAGANLVGRLASTWTQTGSCLPAVPAAQSTTALTRRSILAYDPMGRILSEQQCTRVNCAATTPYSLAYDYDYAGNLIHHSDGLGTRNFTNCYDTAGRLLLVAGKTVNCSMPSFDLTTNLFTSPSYTPAGGLLNATFGTGLQLSRTYDVRLRIRSEVDTGGNAAPLATPGTATIQVLGTTDQTH